MSSIYSTITEQVIAQVKNRPILWDKKNELYGNIQAMHFEWLKVAGVLKRDKDFLKKCWRRLRDVFRVEVRKLKAPDEPTLPLINYYSGVWPHFESMLFLKDSISKRIPRLFTPEEIETQNECNMNSTQEDPTSPELCFLEQNSIEEEVNVKPVVMNCESVFVDPPLEEHLTENPQANIGQNIKAAQIINTAQNMNEIVQNESRGVKRRADDWGRETDYDEDVNFAKSIVNYMRRLNPVRKLLVRNDIQNILLRELMCEQCRCKDQQKSCNCD